MPRELSPDFVILVTDVNIALDIFCCTTVSLSKQLPCCLETRDSCRSYDKYGCLHFFANKPNKRKQPKQTGILFRGYASPACLFETFETLDLLQEKSDFLQCDSVEMRMRIQRLLAVLFPHLTR